MHAKRIWWSCMALALTLPAIGQDSRKIAPIPADPLEMVSGRVETVDSPARRQSALELLNRAGNNYTLRSAPVPYDLKVTFTVNSGGQTDFDGVWHMEDIFDPQQGLHWTAQAAAGYSITEIIANGRFYADATQDYIPLRLHEARAALFSAMPSPADLVHDRIRTSASSFQGASLTCLLLSGSGMAASSGPGRRWEETEECIDPQSGLLKVHSQAPGRYFAYDYSNAPQLAGHVLPSKITITEAGHTVSEISVDSLQQIPAVDQKLFIPTQRMLDRGRAVSMAGALKFSRVAGVSPGSPQTVCVFGLLTPSGQLVEAHSLQPSSPDSTAAVEAAKEMSFSRPSPAGLNEVPQQHLVFIIERFVSQK